jgi:hypothetical protein
MAEEDRREEKRREEGECDGSEQNSVKQANKQTNKTRPSDSQTARATLIRIRRAQAAGLVSTGLRQALLLRENFKRSFKKGGSLLFSPSLLCSALLCHTIWHIWSALLCSLLFSYQYSLPFIRSLLFCWPVVDLPVEDSILPFSSLCFHLSSVYLPQESKVSTYGSKLDFHTEEDILYTALHCFLQKQDIQQIRNMGTSGSFDTFRARNTNSQLCWRGQRCHSDISSNRN